MSNSKQLTIRNSTAEFLIFTGQKGEDNIEVRFQNQIIWMTQKLIAELFSCTTDNISLHLKNIFKEEELNPDSVTEEYSITARDKKKYKVKHYNLNAIISVGYRVNSIRATQFRQWATHILSSFAMKGYVLDNKRLENGVFLDEDYFETLLEEIREIRLSERRFYQKITDIYTTSIDYNQNAPTTKSFFANVQNKLHFAIHGYTAAELIKERANSKKRSMGLSTWTKAPKGKILKSDTKIAKNYLKKDELKSLGRIVNVFLELAESRAIRKVPSTMEDWNKLLNSFIKLDKREVLKNKGNISVDRAHKFATSEFEKFRIVQDRLFENDFDKEMNKLMKDNHD